MEWLNKMNDVVAYIESHLDGEIEYSEMARLSCYSEHHFRRLFSFVAGIPVSDYIRRRRLSQAALELAAGNVRIIDLAVKYGYQSADAFSRAFHALHGVLPSNVTKHDVRLKAYPRLIFQFSIRGNVEMNFRFVQQEAFRLVGYKENMENLDKGFHPKLWDTLGDFDYAALEQLNDGTAPAGIVHAVFNKLAAEENSEETIDYYIAAASTRPCPEGMAELNAEAGLWAVFEAEGAMPEAMLSTWERIYTEWFPTSGYELALSPELIVDLDDNRQEIWIPVLTH